MGRPQRLSPTISCRCWAKGCAAWTVSRSSPDLPDSALTPEYMLENFWIVGDPDHCATQIRQLYEDTGGFGTLLILCHDWGEERKKGLRSLKLLAEETLPQLADLSLH